MRQNENIALDITASALTFFSKTLSSRTTHDEQICSNGQVRQGVYNKIYDSPAVRDKSFIAHVRNRSRLPKIIKCSQTHSVTIVKRLLD